MQAGVYAQLSCQSVSGRCHLLQFLLSLFLNAVIKWDAVDSQIPAE